MLSFHILAQSFQETSAIGLSVTTLLQISLVRVPNLYQDCLWPHNEIISSVFKAQYVSKPVIHSFAAHSFQNCKKFLKVCKAPGRVGF